jgi:lipopolysaccharide transport system ATP-binding protein
MTDVAIRAQALGKRYRIGGPRRGYLTLRDALSEGLAATLRTARALVRARPRGARIDNTIWALKDVTFEIARGEVVGIIGRNGSGKSTLLKVLSRITRPTTGSAEITGRVGSLLEVGTGFHPELTGRDNIYLNGAVLGMKRAEIFRKFDEIVAFAEVERFIDTPVKHYSSGMYLRLAFAVAAHLDTEILFVDEVLAVGDEAFQKKCLGKMDDVARAGRTVLFVSHNLQAVSALTRRALLLDGGNLLFTGETHAALERYRAVLSSGETYEFSAPHKQAGLLSARVITSTGGRLHAFGKPLAFEFELFLPKKPRSGVFSFELVDEAGRPVAHLWLLDSDKPWSRDGRLIVRCVLPHPRLYMGNYAVNTHLSDRASHERLETLSEVCGFEVVMDEVSRGHEWTRGACTYLEDGEWSVT